MIEKLIKKYRKWKEKRKAIKTCKTLRKYIGRHFINNKKHLKKIYLGVNTDE